MASDIYRATQSFATVLDGEPVSVTKGELVRAGHALLKGREELFEPFEPRIRFDDVEDASATPGRKRGRPAKPAAPEPEAEVEPERGDEPEPGAEAAEGAPAGEPKSKGRG